MKPSVLFHRLLAVLLGIALLNCAAAREEFPASSPLIQYMGRVAADGDAVQLAYPGIAIQITFTGPSITLAGAVSGQAAYFNSSIDGVDLPRVDLAPGAFAREFKHYLDPRKPHTLRLVRRSESWNGIVELSSVAVESGALLPSPVLPERKILCIGDSITAGDKVDLLPPETPGLHAWNAERTFGWLLAKEFNAQVALVACGGRGLIRDWQGLETASTGPQFFERSLPDDPAALWDHDRYQPDLVTIGLGTNDLSQGIPDQKRFVAAYIDFVSRIHEVHPDAKILLLSGPWFGEGDPKRAALNSAIEETVAHFASAGETFVSRHIFDTTYPGSELDAHPHALQHRAMADDIGRSIKHWLGW